jgi:hypothetical protein
VIVYIPLHHACKNLSAKGLIPVLSDIPNPALHDETYLSLSVKNEADLSLVLGNGGGAVMAVPALGIAVRMDREDSPITDAESYTQRGFEIAESLHFGSALEYLAAWMNEMRKQANYCHDIHAVMSLDILEKLPLWIRYDIFSILESEAMKQVFAKRYLIEAKRENFNIPVKFEQAIRLSAECVTDDILTELLSELMRKPPIYSGIAKNFDVKVQGFMDMLKSL